MNDLSRKTASIYINHASAKEALEALQKQADKLNEKIKKGADAGKSMVNEISKLNKVQNDIKAVQDQIDKGLRPSFNQMQTTVSRLRNELKRMSEDAPGYAAKFKEFQKASLELDRMGTSISQVKKETGGLKAILAEAMPVLGIAAAVGFFKGAVDEAIQAQEATDRFANALDNAGRSDAFERLTQQADDLAKSVGYLDNDDVVGVFDKLVTYGKLTEAQMSKLAPIIIDFAAKSRISLPEATDAILRALEGNAKALKTYGVDIKEAGNETERFNIITTDLAGKVEGAAKTFSESYAGSLATTKQNVKDLQEEIGNNLLPVLQTALDFLSGAINGISDVFNSAKKAVLGIWNFAKGGQADEFLAGIGQDINKRVSSTLTDLASKDLDTQKRLLGSYKSILKTTQEDIATFLASSDKNNRQRQLQLTQRYLEDLRLVEGAEKVVSQSVLDSKKKLNEDVSKEDESAAKKRLAEALREMKQFQKELDDMLKQNADEYDKTALSPMLYELKKVNESYDKDLAKLKEGLKRKLLTQQQYNDALFKLQEIHFQKMKALQDKYMPGSGAAGATGADAAAVIGALPKDIQGMLADAAADVTLSTGKARLKAQLHVLDLQMQQELLNTELTEKQKEAIRKRYDDARAAITQQSYIQQFQEIVNTAQQIMGIFQTINEIQQQKDEQRIKQINNEADLQKNKLKDLYDRKIISEEVYGRKIKAIDREREKEQEQQKRKAFEREKRLKFINAIISGAQGVIQTIANFGPPTYPNFTGIIAMAITAATNAAQMGLIASQRYARGGVFEGPSHQEGGMPVYSRGRKVAELEGGEPILSRNTYANNRPLIDALLYSSMYQNGASILPSWRTRPYSAMNLGNINSTMGSMGRFERGGVFAGASNNTQQPDLNLLLGAFIAKMNEPLRAYVAYSDVRAGNELDNKLRSETSLVRV